MILIYDLLICFFCPVCGMLHALHQKEALSIVDGVKENSFGLVETFRFASQNL